MRDLKDTHPRIYKCFKEKGYHTVRHAFPENERR